MASPQLLQAPRGDTMSLPSVCDVGKQRRCFTLSLSLCHHLYCFMVFLSSRLRGLASHPQSSLCLFFAPHAITYVPPHRTPSRITTVASNCPSSLLISDLPLGQHSTDTSPQVHQEPPGGQSLTAPSTKLRPPSWDCLWPLQLSS